MRVLIAVPVYNRLAVTQLCLRSIYQSRRGAVLHVYDDHSTEFDGSLLAVLCDELIRLPPRNRRALRMEPNTKGWGSHHLRWYQLRDFLQRPEFDALYLTDADALHDPDYMDCLEAVPRQLDEAGDSLPICLYNSRYDSCAKNCLWESDQLLVRRTAPAISQFYGRWMVERIVAQLDQLTADPACGWDYVAPMLLDHPIATTRTSYVEHLGALPGSIQNPLWDWNHDRAINPTRWLAKRREQAIAYLEGRRTDSPALESAVESTPV